MRFGWEAQLVQGPMEDGTRVFLWLPKRDGADLVIGFGESGRPIIETVAEGVQPDFDGLLFPMDAVSAIARAAAPGPSEDVTKELRAALSTEQMRVDRVLDELLGRTT